MNVALPAVAHRPGLVIPRMYRTLLLLLIVGGFGQVNAFAQEYKVGGSQVRVGDLLYYKNPYLDEPPRPVRAREFGNGGIWLDRTDVDTKDPTVIKQLHVGTTELDWLTRPSAPGETLKAAAAPTPEGDAQTVATAVKYLCGTWDLGVAGADHVTDGKKVADHIYGAKTGSITLNADGTYVWTFTTSVPTIRGRWRPCGPKENYVEGQGVRLLHAVWDHDWTLIKDPHADMVDATDGTGYYERGYRHK